MILRPALLFLILLYWPAYGQEDKEDLNDSAHFHSSASLALANVDLPAQVMAPMGQVTLFADFDNAGEKGVPLYLVNRSSEPLRVASQDGDIYLKLEFQREDGTWQRAQGHINSWCGNSYGAEFINPGQHIKLEGYHPLTGTPAKIRYACYGSEELLSNVSQGFFRQEDVTTTEDDGLADSMTPSPLSQRLRWGEVEIQWISWRDRIASLRLAQVLGGLPNVKGWAGKWQQELMTKQALSLDESEALAALTPLLKRTWADASDPEKLVRHCMELLVAPSKGTAVFGSPESTPALLWQLLADLAEGPGRPYPPQKSVPADAWQPVFKLASQRLLTMDESSQIAALRLLHNVVLTDEFLSDAEWEPLLLSGHPLMVELAATSLSRRTRWDRLVELGSKLSAADQVTVLYALAKGQITKEGRGLDGYGRIRYPQQASPEDKFWRHCMKTSPAQVARAWKRLAGETEAILPYETLLNQYLLDYWGARISAWEQAEGDFELKTEGDELKDTLDYIIPRARANEDGNLQRVQPGEGRNISLDEWTVLLRRLVTNRGYEMTSDPFADSRDTRRDYVLQKQAMKTLKSLGEPVETN